MGESFLMWAEGINDSTMLRLSGETGSDMSRIPSVKHFVSRLGTNRVEREIISDMLEDCCIFDLDVFIKQKAIETGQRSIIKLPDAIIAATSNQKELSLVIADRGFQKIPDSDLIWIDIQ